LSARIVAGNATSLLKPAVPLFCSTGK